LQQTNIVATTAKSVLIVGILTVFIYCNYYLFNNQRREFVYLEPIQNTQVLIRQTKDDKIKAKLSLYTLLYQNKNIETTVLQSTNTSILIDKSVRDYVSGTFSPKSFSISSSTPELTVKFTGILSNNSFFVKSSIIPTTYTTSSQFTWGIDLGDLTKVNLTDENGVISIQDDSCMQQITVNNGNYLETRNNIVFFQYSYNQLDLTINYDCSL